MHIEHFIHREDKQALSFLKGIPLADTTMKQIMKLYYERMTYGENMGNKIRMSPTQIPHIYHLLPPICEQLGIPEPEFYLENNPIPNAYAMGEDRPNITLHSGIIDLLTTEELKAVIAHECGHLFFHHMLYTTMANFMLYHIDLADDIREAYVIALLYWNRKSELSCDRVAAYITSPETTISMLSRLAGGPHHITYDFNVDEYIEQAKIYDSIREDNLWDRTLQAYITMDRDHPFVSVRVRELLKWTNTQHYINLKAGIPVCPYCHAILDGDETYCGSCGRYVKQ